MILRESGQFGALLSEAWKEGYSGAHQSSALSAAIGMNDDDDDDDYDFRPLARGFLPAARIDLGGGSIHEAREGGRCLSELGEQGRSESTSRQQARRGSRERAHCCCRLAECRRRCQGWTGGQSRCVYLFKRETL